MAKRKSRSDSLDDLKAKGAGCLLAGFVLLFVPILGGALLPLAWVLLLLGVVLLALTSLMSYFRSHQDESTSTTARAPQARSSIPAKKTALLRESAGRAATRQDRNASGERLEPSFQKSNDVSDRATTWSLDVFASIEWRRFEAVCEALFAQAGFRTQSQSHGADGGVDIWLYSKNAQGPVAIVQCKHWKTQAVGVRELREFFGVMASHKLARGTYATTSTFTLEAQTFANANGINAMDGNRLIKQIATRTPEQQQQLLNIAFEGDYWRPTCASCGIKLVERQGDRSAFWGCTNFPRCKVKIFQSSAMTARL